MTTTLRAFAVSAAQSQSGSQANSSAPKRRGWVPTISLRSLLLLVTLISLSFGCLRTPSSWQLAFARQGLFTALCYSPDGQLLAAAERGKYVRVWDASTGQERFRLTSPPRSTDESQLCISADNRRLYFATSQGLLAWELARGTSLPTSAIGTPVQFAARGNKLLERNAAGAPSVVRDLANRKVEFDLDDYPHKLLIDASLTADGSAAILVYPHSCQWQSLTSNQLPLDHGFPDALLKRIADVRSFTLHSVMSFKPSIAPDGQHFAITLRGLVVLYARGHQQPYATIVLPNLQMVGDLIWSPDSRLLAITSFPLNNLGDPPVILDVATGQLSVKCSAPNCPNVVFDSSNARLIGYSTSGWQIWDATTGELLMGSATASKGTWTMGVSSPTKAAFAKLDRTGIEVWRRSYPESWGPSIRLGMQTATALCAMLTVASLIADQWRRR